MAVAIHELSRAEREEVRLRFFREFRGVDGCSSVSVRKDKESGALYLSVGVSGNGSRLPDRPYAGLEIRRYSAPSAVHAVQYRG